MTRITSLPEARASARQPTETSLPAAIARAGDLDTFRSMVSSSFVPLSVSGNSCRPFTAVLTSAAADEVVFTDVSARPHLVERTRESITRGGEGYFKVSLLLSGSSMLVQDGREVLMQPGDLTIYDTSRPYSLLFDRDFQNLIMMFPKSRLDLPSAFLDDLTAVSLNEQHQHLSPVVTSFLSHFPARLTPLDTAARSKLARTSLDLLDTLLTDILGCERYPADPQAKQFERIRQYIDDHLGSPALCPEQIAAAHFVSVRTLHAQFSRAGTTVSTWIRERRLERCRTDLGDAALLHRSVSEIATRWGFNDAAHFSRVFRAAFGMPPSAYRRARTPEPTRR
ncbi:helix-turn-helix domain-containing protein [uncultured Agrococcus sp.]|uniref:AraC-like ligand-binding domain-containing protein n=1 Tax=uncultured Agrococcus sp. TaxID=382258 RepID=UPI0025DAD0A9|nr:helix-turn-helix domain-containing protein [uncultured Agrococcus sp.]